MKAQITSNFVNPKWAGRTGKVTEIHKTSGPGPNALTVVIDGVSLMFFDTEVNLIKEGPEHD